MFRRNPLLAAVVSLTLSAGIILAQDDFDEEFEDEEPAASAMPDEPAEATAVPATTTPAAPSATPAEKPAETKPVETKPVEGKPAVGKPGNKRPPVTLTLPETYHSKDLDRDGQLGMYEWDRQDLAQFRTMDRNGDGFVTPQELLPRTARQVSASAVQVTMSAPPPEERRDGGREERERGGRRGNRGGGMGGGRFGGGRGGGGGANPQQIFGFVDRDEDGSISQEEFDRSRLVKPMFERAGIKPQFPLDEATFSQHYQAASAPTGG